jgi:hypothetical protein
MVFYIKEGTQSKDIWEQYPEAYIWTQMVWEGGIEKAPQLGT